MIANKLPASFTRNSKNTWAILVRPSHPTKELTDESAAVGQLAVDSFVTANITLTVDTRDIPIAINSFNAFFSSWRAVLGFIAVSGTIVGSILVLRVRPGP